MTVLDKRSLSVTAETAVSLFAASLRRVAGALTAGSAPEALYNSSMPDTTMGAALEPTETHKPLRIKTYLMIAVMIVAGPLGNVLLGKGMKQAGTPVLWPLAALPHSAYRIVSSGSIWLGVASLITFFVAYMLALSWADYSFVQPASSLAYAVVALLGFLVLGERIPPLQWAGIAVICLGVFVVGRTHPHTTEHS